MVTHYNNRQRDMEGTKKEFGEGAFEEKILHGEGINNRGKMER